MPQMAPLWWETLYIIFIFMFMIMIMIIYYNKSYSPKSNNYKKKINQLNWKW
uniref:ATP synthase complex subunit 8 n=1 Tax=Aeschyntelus notatus TaxID=498933 RepID=B7SM78_9HEMI|nr:ATP synthase F0 subunit 8 [Aeschyntelus notatus]ABZ01972.1 ATP synthase F0 subunit 8 [Aeschyntelus notatus]